MYFTDENPLLLPVENRLLYFTVIPEKLLSETFFQNRIVRLRRPRKTTDVISWKSFSTENRPSVSPKNPFLTRHLCPNRFYYPWTPLSRSSSKCGQRTKTTSIEIPCLISNERRVYFSAAFIFPPSLFFRRRAGYGQIPVVSFSATE